MYGKGHEARILTRHMPMFNPLHHNSMKPLPLAAFLAFLCMICHPTAASAGEEAPAKDPSEERYIGSSADWDRLRSELEGDSLSNFRRARHLESRQLAGKPDGVRRDCDETLVLKTREAGELKLADADLDNDAFIRFSYYDSVPALDAWVVHVQRWESHSWMLVSRRTGVQTGLSGLPVVAPDRKRFATASYDLEAHYNPNELVIWKIAEDGTYQEEWKLTPEEWGPTFIHWFPFHQPLIRVRCENPAPDARPVTRVFRFAEKGGWAQHRGDGPSPIKVREADLMKILARLGEADARVGRVIATYEGSVKDGHLTAVIARDRDAGIQAMRVDAKSARGEIRLMAMLDGDGDLFMPVSTVGEVARIKGVGQWLDELGGWMGKVFGGLGDWEGGDKFRPEPELRFLLTTTNLSLTFGLRPQNQHFLSNDEVLGAISDWDETTLRTEEFGALTFDLQSGALKRQVIELDDGEKRTLQLMEWNNAVDAAEIRAGIDAWRPENVTDATLGMMAGQIIGGWFAGFDQDEAIESIDEERLRQNLGQARAHLKRMMAELDRGNEHFPPPHLLAPLLSDENRMRAKWLELKPGAKADDRAGLIEFAAGELRRALDMSNDDLAKQLMARIPIPPEPAAGHAPAAMLLRHEFIEAMLGNYPEKMIKHSWDSQGEGA